MRNAVWNAIHVGFEQVVIAIPLHVHVYSLDGEGINVRVIRQRANQRVSQYWVSVLEQKILPCHDTAANRGFYFPLSGALLSAHDETYASLDWFLKGIFGVHERDATPGCLHSMRVLCIGVGI